jgi:hypothetical protein
MPPRIAVEDQEVRTTEDQWRNGLSKVVNPALRRDARLYVCLEGRRVQQ